MISCICFALCGSPVLSFNRKSRVAAECKGLQLLKYPTLLLFLFFRKHLDGTGVFRGRHPGYFFKLPGKIVDGSIPQGICNLGEVHILLPDQFLRPGDFQPGKVSNDAAAAFVVEQLLELGSAN